MTNERERTGDYRGHPSQTGYPRESTALLVIDPVNDFLSEGGKAGPTEAEVEKLYRSADPTGRPRAPAGVQR
ncbi:MAG TPA: hypothetical protein VM265_00045 [Sphingomicrobium sp.]|nr:hypothetical protein [Sphingomicrobium sp.]